MTDSKSARSDADKLPKQKDPANAGRNQGLPAGRADSAETRADPSSERCEVASEEACSCHLNQHFHAANHCRELSRLRSELDELRGKFTELESELAEAERLLKSGLLHHEVCGKKYPCDWPHAVRSFLARSKKEKGP